MAKSKKNNKKRPLPSYSNKSLASFKRLGNIPGKMSTDGKVTAIIAIVGIVISIISIAVTVKLAKTEKSQTDVVPYSGGGFVYGESPLDLSQGNAYYERGQEFFRICDYESALQQYESALVEFEKVSYVDVDVARIQCSIGLTYKRQGNLDTAIQWYTKAIGTLKSLSESDEIYSVQSYAFYLRGFAFLENRDLEHAQMDCESCLNLVMQDNFRGECTYASALYLQGAIYTASYYGIHSPYPVHGGTDLGVTWYDAMYCFDTALEYNGAILYPDFGGEFPSRFDAIKAYKYSELDALYDEETFIFGCVYYFLENPDAETAAILNYRAKLLIMLYEEKFLDEAIVESEVAMQIYNELPADKREGIQDTYFLLANANLFKEVYEHEGAIDTKTIEYYCQQMEKALEYTKKWCGESKNTAIAYENMGGAYMLAKNYESALENFQEAELLFSKLGLDEDVQKQKEFIESLEIMRDYDGEWYVGFGEY